MPKISCDKEVNEFFKKQEKEATAIISTCAGVFVVGGSGLLAGKRAASNFHMTKYLTHVGAIPSHAEVETDGKFYSAGPAVGSYEVALMVVKKMYGEDAAQHIEQNLLEYSPNPVLGVGSPELAGKFKTAISKMLIAPINPIYKWTAKRGYRANRA